MLEMAAIHRAQMLQNNDSPSFVPVIDALHERYRIPQEFLRLRVSPELSEDSGFFSFGSTHCFGRSSAGFRRSSVSEPLFDTSSAVKMGDGFLELPFDPSEVANNLRLERYSMNQQHA